MSSTSIFSVQLIMCRKIVIQMKQKITWEKVSTLINLSALLIYHFCNVGYGIFDLDQVYWCCQGLVNKNIT